VVNPNNQHLKAIGKPISIAIQPHPHLPTARRGRGEGMLAVDAGDLCLNRLFRLHDDAAHFGFRAQE